jgi:hypothetical protein
MNGGFCKMTKMDFKLLVKIKSCLRIISQLYFISSNTSANANENFQVRISDF